MKSITWQRRHWSEFPYSRVFWVIGHLVPHGTRKYLIGNCHGITQVLCGHLNLYVVVLKYKKHLLLLKAATQLLYHTAAAMSIEKGLGIASEAKK